MVLGQVAALVLAAGRSSRMGGANKLLATIDGGALIRHVVRQPLAAGISEVLVVTGHDAEQIRSALAGEPVSFVHNPRFEQGLASSLAAGLALLGARASGVVVCLGDMPRVRSAHIVALLRAFEAGSGHAICAPFHAGRRGNPVLWPARCFSHLSRLQGDLGGRALLEQAADALCKVEVADDGVLLDVDTPEDLSALGHRDA